MYAAKKGKCDVMTELQNNGADSNDQIDVSHYTATCSLNHCKLFDIIINAMYIYSILGEVIKSVT